MPSRRHFISAAAMAAAAGLSGTGSAPADAAPPKGPSVAALAQATSLQRSLPDAHLTDELVQQIAGDIDGYASVAADFRKGTLRNWDEPDFTFVAGPTAAKQ
jgi:hypothetical protein